MLHGKTKGYRHHPQLERFRQHPDLSGAIAAYLFAIVDEAIQWGYVFDIHKILCEPVVATIAATDGQLMYEWQHLLEKIRGRSPFVFDMLGSIAAPEPHPCFHIVAGPVALWEKVSSPTL